MKAVIRIICAAALLTTSSLWAATVNNVELSYEQGYTVAKIYVDGAVRYTHQSEVAKDGKPFRIIVDLLAATHNLGSKQFLEVPACAVKGIRSSQFAVTPENVCRVVFDMMGETVYRTEEQADCVAIYISDGFSQPFTNWSSKSWVASTKAPEHDEPNVNPPAVAQVESTEQPEVSASEANAAISEDHLDSLQPEESTPVEEKVEAAAEQADEESLVDTVVVSDKSEEDSIVESPADSVVEQEVAVGSFAAHTSEGATIDTVVEIIDSLTPELQQDSAETLDTNLDTEGVDEIQPIDALADSLFTGDDQQATETTSVVTPDAVPETVENDSVAVADSTLSSVSAPEETEVSATPSFDDSSQLLAGSTKVRERTARKNTSPSSPLGPDFDFSLVEPTTPATTPEREVPLATTDIDATTQPQPAMLADADAKVFTEESKPAQTTEASAKPAPAETKPVAPPIAKPAAMPAKASESKSTISSGSDTMASQKPSPADVAPAVDSSTGKPTDADANKSKGTARFRRDPITSKKMRGTLVAEFPQRLVVQYKGKTGRDPFETLIDQEKQYNTPVEKRVPNVEGLTLVGVIETGWGDNRALFEDRSGHGFIMQSGDKVQKGYVLRVEKDRVYFQLFEYGWSRTVSITIEDE